MPMQELKPKYGNKINPPRGGSPAAAPSESPSQIKPKYTLFGNESTTPPAETPQHAKTPDKSSSQVASQAGGPFDWLVANGSNATPVPLKPKYEIAFRQPAGQAEPKKENNEPGWGAKALAYSIIAVRQIGNAVAPKPQAPPKQQSPPPDPEADRQALIALQARYGAVPFSEVGNGENAKAIRSQLFHTVSPDRWEIEAKERAATRLLEARDAQQKRLAIREARKEIEQLSLAASKGDVISTVHSGSITPRAQFQPTLFDAAKRTVIGNLLVLATRGKLDAEGRSTVDDRIDVDPNQGVIIYDASKGGTPEVRPWSEIGTTYELRVRYPEWAVGANTVLARAGQRGLDIADLGQVQLVDRQQNQTEVSVSMMGARKFVREVQRIKARRGLAQERTPQDVPVFTASDLVPIPRELQGSTPPYLVDKTNTIIIAQDPINFYRQSVADTRPMQPIRRNHGVVDNNQSKGRGNGDDDEGFRSMAEFDPTFDPTKF